MKIICGTDLSEYSRRAVVAANALATRFDQKLDVVHVLHQSIADRLSKTTRELHEQDAKEGLAEFAKLLESRGDRSHTRLIFGNADEELVKLAGEDEVSLLVVGSLGHRDETRWHLGSCAERVAESSPKPTLIVRNGASFEEWSLERTLKIMMAWNFDETSENALRWLAKWRESGPCEITIAHVDWPPAEANRLGVRSNFFASHNEPLVQQVLERDVKERAAAILGGPPEHIVVEGENSRPEYRFSQLVNERRPDLVVCGAHQRHGLGRLTHTSFSRGLLHNSNASVLLVPHTSPCAPDVPKLSRVLVATDFSDLGNRAIPLAYSQAGDGGTVFLIHIAEPSHLPGPLLPQRKTEERSLAADELKTRLRRLIPGGAEERGIKTDTRVVEGDGVAAVICQCAERFGADLICLGSHGRGGLSQLVMGSVAKAVIARTHKPVTIVKSAGS